MSKLSSFMFKSVKIFAAIGILLFFAMALLSVGAGVSSPFASEPARYVKTKHLFKKQLAHMDRKTLNMGMILEEGGDLPTKDAKLPMLSKKSLVAETTATVSLQDYRAHSTLGVIFAPKVSARILQSVLIL